MIRDRARHAAIGLALTLVPLILSLVLHFWLAQQIFNVRGSWVNYEANDLFLLKRYYLLFHIWVAVMLTGHWLLAFALGAGNILCDRIANFVLVGSGFLFFCGVITNATMRVPQAIFLPLCKVFGISDRLYGFGFDGATSDCLNFQYGTWIPLFFYLPFCLLVVSLVLRVWRSRRSIHAS